MFVVDVESGVINLVVYEAQKVHECWYLRKLEFQVSGSCTHNDLVKASA